MNNKIMKLYKPINYFSRMCFRNIMNSQIIQNLPQKAFSEQIILDITTIEKLWGRYKDVNILNSHLYQRCTKNAELSTYMLDLINCASNRKPASQTLVFELVKTFSNYLQENGMEISVTVDQNIEVLSSIVSLKNYQLLQYVCNVFKIHETPLAYRTFIKELIQEHKFEEANLLVSALHLQNEFDIEEILLPLLLEGCIHSASLYIANCHDLQLKVTKILDGYLEIKNNILDPCSRSRKAFKALNSLVNIYKISLDNCPNLQFIRSKGAINLLIHRRSQQSVSEATWEEMIKNIVKDNEDLKKHVIWKLLRKKDKKTALKMAEEFNVNPDFLRSEGICENSTSVEVDQINNSESFDTEENFVLHDVSEEYLKLTVKTEDIKVISNKEDYLNCIIDLSQNYKMVGIDSEWKPQFGLSRERLSLIQLAVHDKVYILDVLSLSGCLEREDWDKLLDGIFGNPNIIILGCAIMSDVHMILQSIKGTKGKGIKFSHILDMALFYQKLREVYPIEMSDRSDTNISKNNVSLSSLCEIVLGKPLNKENRLCDWEKRPLMEMQLEYAALDAHCLLQMYDKLKEEAVKKNMNFEHIATVAIVLTTSQWKPKRKFKGVKSELALQVHRLIPIEQIKVVTVSSFEDLGKELRKFGADVVIVKGDDSVNKIVEISKNEGRLIIYPKEAYYEIQNAKEGTCYFISRNEFNVTNFLHHFNVQISMKSMYSRCISCNSENGLKISPEDLNVLHDLCKTSTSINSLLKDNICSFSSELQTVFSEIQNSGIVIEFSPKECSSHINEYSFLCKKCGHVS